MRYHNQQLRKLSPRQRSYLLKKKQKLNSPLDSLRESASSLLSNVLIQTTKLAGYTKTYVTDWRNFLTTLLKRSLQDLCSLCRQGTEKVRLLPFRSLLGTWADTLNTNLLAVLTRARSLWGSVAKSGSSYVNQLIKPHLKPVWIRTVSQLKHGLLLVVAGTLLLVLAVVLLVRALTS